jgi:alkylated DNA repair dioxygenase AlkB
MQDPPSPHDLLELDIAFEPSFFLAHEADALMQALRAEIPWTQHTISMFGQKLLAPRLSSWHGSADARYRYSGTQYDPLPNTPALQHIQDRLSAHALRFNSVLCNYYRNGQDSMGWHSDDEPELGPQPVIASISFGAPRRFCFRHKRTKIRHELTLRHGSLLIMRGLTQHAWQHALPKTARPILRGGDPARINLTYRWIFPQQEAKAL